MYDLLIVEVAEPVDKLVEEVLSFRNSESFPLFDEIEHILDTILSTPLLQSSRSM